MMIVTAGVNDVILQAIAGCMKTLMNLNQKNTGPNNPRSDSLTSAVILTLAHNQRSSQIKVPQEFNTKKPPHVV